MADGALPQTRRKRASQISRKIEFGLGQEIAETGISEEGFAMLTTAEQTQRINRHLAPRGCRRTSRSRLEISDASGSGVAKL